MKRVPLILLAILFLAAAACRSEPPSPPLPAPAPLSEGQYRIGVSFPTTDLIYRKTMMEIVTAEYPPGNTDKRAQLLVRDGENSQEKQNQDLMNMIAQDVDGIVIIPYTTEGPLPILQYANNKEIPVIAVDNLLERSTSARFVSYVGANHYAMGLNAAEMLAEALEKRYPQREAWNVIQLTGVPGSSGAIDRGQAIDDFIGRTPRIRLLARYNAEFTLANARSVMADCLELYDRIDGVICQNDLMAEGCYQAIQEAGRDGEMIIIGIDGQRSVVELMAEGKIHGTVHQSPQMITVGVEILCDYLDGKPVRDTYYQKIHRVYPEDARRYLDEDLAW